MLEHRDDGGIKRGPLPENTTRTSILVAMLTLAIYMSAIVDVKAFAMFKRRNTIYFWSLLVASWGIMSHSLGIILKWHITALRLSSPRFAYLKIIEEAVFSTTRFFGVKDQVDSLEYLDVARIAPFVKAIWFAAPSQDSIQDKGLLLSEGLRVAWIRLLRALPVVAKASLFSYNFEGSQWQSDVTGQGTPSRMGDALMAAAVTCLASAGTRVRGLKVACHLTGTLDWQSLPGWEELDLSGLENVTYAPEPDASVLPNEDDDARQAVLAATNVSALFDKCQGSIRKIEIYGDIKLIWPGEQTLSLPALRYLSLRFSGIHIRNLGFWLRHMPRLEYFWLAGDYVTDGGETSWRCLFDATREHPRNRNGGMTIQWEHVLIQTYLTIMGDVRLVGE
ncbi:MAG: hypothetical protein Q9192_006517 [Flavoplaca navasiana]